MYVTNHLQGLSPTLMLARLVVGSAQNQAMEVSSVDFPSSILTSLKDDNISVPNTNAALNILRSVEDIEEIARTPFRNSFSRSLV